MAFQAGTKVDPRLMQADYSGFANAASIQANALSKLGAQIGDGIKDYQKAKQKKKDDEDFKSAIMPTLLQMSEGDVKEAQDTANMIMKNPKLYSDVMSAKNILAQEEKNKINLSMINGVAGGTITPQDALAAGVSPAQVKSAMEIGNYDPSVTASTLNSIQGAMTESGVKLNPETGQYFKPDTGIPLFPFDNTEVPVDFNVKGAKEYSEIYSDPGVTAFDPNKYKLLSTQ